jgi:hypothetical protein
MLNPGDFVRHLTSGVYKDEGVVKVVIVSGDGDLVVEHPNGALTVCKATDLGISDDEAA